MTKYLPGNLSWRGCAGKVQHLSRGKAEALARALTRQRDVMYTAYFCLRCAHRENHEVWHVGKEHV